MKLKAIHSVLFFYFQVPVADVDQGLLEEAVSAPVLAVASPSAVRSAFDFNDH